MVVWLIFAAMTAVVALALVRPLARSVVHGSGGHGSGGHGPELIGADAAVYKDQLAEIEADRARGLITDVEAEAARVEISRRLLAAADVGREQGASGEGGRRVPDGAAYGLAAAIAAVGLGFYLALGSPWLEGMPHSERVAEQGMRDAKITDLVGAVERRLKEHPEDGRGWDVIAPVYLRQGRYDEAAAAYLQASRLLGETPGRLAGFAQATVLARDGLVTEPARTAFEKLRSLQPDAPEPAFWIAVGKEQDGQLEAAASELERLLKRAPAEAPWRAFVATRLSEVRQKLGLEAPAPGQTSDRGPTSEDVAAAAKMTAQDRQAMIRQMVDGLAAKLNENARDLEGWKKLVRSYLVLGERDKALEALANARKGLAGDNRSLDLLEALARELGLKS